MEKIESNGRRVDLGESFWIEERGLIVMEAAAVGTYCWTTSLGDCVAVW